MEAIRLDYAARLKALGMSDQDIEEFNAYWKQHSQPFRGQIF